MPSRDNKASRWFAPCAGPLHHGAYVWRNWVDSLVGPRWVAKRVREYGQYLDLAVMWCPDCRCQDQTAQGMPAVLVRASWAGFGRRCAACECHPGFEGSAGVSGICVSPSPYGTAILVLRSFWKSWCSMKGRSHEGLRT